MTPYQIINKLSKESSVKTELQSLLAELLQCKISPAFITDEISAKNGAFRGNNNAFERLKHNYNGEHVHPNRLAQLLLEAKVTEQLQVQYMPHKVIITAIEMRIGNDGAGYSRRYSVAQKSIKASTRIQKFSLLEL